MDIINSLFKMLTYHIYQKWCLFKQYQTELNCSTSDSRTQCDYSTITSVLRLDRLQLLVFNDSVILTFLVATTRTLTATGCQSYIVTRFISTDAQVYTSYLIHCCNLCVCTV